jgi:cytolysin (calcineurin-like family phosphatase)
MKFKKLLGVLVLVIFITSCAMFTLPQTPQDKSSFFMSYYMAQLKDYNARYAAIQPGDAVSDLDKTILEAKYAFVMNAWYPIAAYDGYVSTGEVPPAALEQQVFGLIDGLERFLQEGK